MVPARIPRSNSKGKKRKIRPHKKTMTPAAIKGRKRKPTSFTLKHDRTKNQLGMFKISNSFSPESIAQDLIDCAGASRHLIIPQSLLRAFDEDIHLVAVMSFLLYMENKLASDHGEWFVVKYPDIERIAGVKRRKIVMAMKRFREIGIIKTSRKSIPAMQHYKIDKDMIVQIAMERILNYKDPLIELGIVEIT